MDTMMGNTNVRFTVRDFVVNHMPMMIDMAREQYQYTPEQLPYITSVDVTEPNMTDTYPAFGSYFTGHSNFRRTDFFANGEEYEYQCEATFFFSAKTAYLGVDSAGIDVYEDPGDYSAIRQRDDYMGLFRNLCLQYPSMLSAGKDAEIHIDLNTWRESYSDIMKVSDARNPYYLANAAVTVTLRVTERTYVPVIGNITGTSVILEKKNRQEPFDD